MYPSNKKEIEAQKIVAEKLNGRFAMLGIIAALGAYLTTGQIIPVSYNETLDICRKIKW
ncbi:MAG: hypothetical protein CM15mV28_1550 [Thaumasvirus sp.]|nr:MAG: hypothetical protein CM15mV28_1550 [Thaumasvirus sp.]